VTTWILIIGGVWLLLLPVLFLLAVAGYPTVLRRRRRKIRPPARLYPVRPTQHPRYVDVTPEAWRARSEQRNLL
jgi:hypothetical protein